MNDIFGAQAECDEQPQRFLRTGRAIGGEQDPAHGADATSGPGIRTVPDGPRDDAPEGSSVVRMALARPLAGGEDRRMTTDLGQTPAPTASGPLSVVLFSGTDDKLSAAAILVAGAAMMGRPVRLFVQYWAADAFRRDRIFRDHGLAGGTTAAQREAFTAAASRGQHWSDTLRQAKELGDVRINVCALALELLGTAQEDFDPLIDDVQGVASFFADAGDAITFI